MIHSNLNNPLIQHDKWSGNRLLSAHVVGLLFVLFSVTTNAAQENKTEIRPAASLWYQELAAQGDVDAKYNLGMMNEVGWSIPVDLKEAIRWYREAAKQGHAEAQFRLGMLYYLGLGTKKSKLKGESWVRKAAKQGHSFANSLNETLFKEDAPNTLDQMAVLKKVRSIYLQDEAKALNSLQRLIDRAQRKSTVQQQEKEKSTIRERRETRVIVAAANNGETRGTNKTGVSKKIPNAKQKELERIESVVPEFIGNKSVEENRTLARGNLATIRLQANKGLASAQYNLGRMYELGIKVPVDESKALALYKKSADQGYASAQYRLAISMLYGKKTEHDERLGRKWLSAAAENGHQIASNLLSNLTNKDNDFGAGNSLAVSWYLERAIAGNAEAAFSLGKIFEHGWGTVPDKREAVKWYQHANMLGSKDAEEILQVLKAGMMQVTDSANKPEGDAVEDFRPPDWVAYLVAVTLAFGILFWPLLKRGQEEGGNRVRKKITRKEPPLS